MAELSWLTDASKRIKKETSNYIQGLGSNPNSNTPQAPVTTPNYLSGLGKFHLSPETENIFGRVQEMQRSNPVYIPFAPGTPTMERRQFDESNRRFDTEFNYQQARDQTKDQQWKQQFDEDVRRHGLEFGLQHQVQLGNLSARQAELALSRDKFNFDKQQSQQQGGVNLNEETRGMINAIRSGELTPTQALQQINQDVKLGFYTQAEAEYLKQQLGVVSRSTPEAPLSLQEQQSVPTGDLSAQWKTDPTGQRAGAPLYDWISWNKDVRNGRPAGVSFSDWNRLNGPTLSPRR